jgi:hypothetical protein
MIHSYQVSSFTADKLVGGNDIISANIQAIAEQPKLNIQLSKQPRIVASEHPCDWE